MAGTIAVITDLTEIKRAEEALRDERNLLRTVIDHLPNRIFAKNGQGRFVINNHAFARTLDIEDPNTLAGKSDFDLYSTLAANKYRTEDQSILISGKPFHYEGSWNDAQGKSHWFQLIKVPWQNEAKQTIGVIGISTDITQFKEIEQELNRANEKLRVQVDQLYELQDQLKEQALRDPLTQLFNRRYLNETMPREIARALRLGQKLGVLMIDLDHFKMINDTYGHAIGDVVLQAIARLLQGQLRASDVVCRYGGEEILCLLLDPTEESAYQRAQQLRLAIADLSVAVREVSIQITASVGVAVLPLDGTDMVEVLNAADVALYRAKQAGRNCVRRLHGSE